MLECSNAASHKHACKGSNKEPCVNMHPPQSHSKYTVQWCPLWPKFLLWKIKSWMIESSWYKTKRLLNSQHHFTYMKWAPRGRAASTFKLCNPCVLLSFLYRVAPNRGPQGAAHRLLVLNGLKVGFGRMSRKATAASTAVNFEPCSPLAGGESGSHSLLPQ